MVSSIWCPMCVRTYRPSHRPIARSYIYYDDLKYIYSYRTFPFLVYILIQSICANLNVEMWHEKKRTHLPIDAMYAHDETLSFITSSNSFYSANFFYIRIFSHATSVCVCINGQCAFPMRNSCHT